MKLKENIKPFNNSLEKVKDLNVYTYNYNNNNKNLNLADEKQFGFLAQELEETFPNLIQENKIPDYVKLDKDGNGTFKKENDSYKSVNHIGLIPVLTKAIQEQQELIERLEKRITELENK